MRAFVILLTFAAVALGAPQSTDLYGAVGKRDGTCATAAANDTAESFECNPALIVSMLKETVSGCLMLKFVRQWRMTLRRPMAIKMSLRD